jgi:hypothetical protein
MPRGVRNFVAGGVTATDADGGDGGDAPISFDSSGRITIEPTETFTDPAAAVSDGGGVGGEPGQKRGRGRPRTKPAGQKETPRAIGAEGVAAILVTVHAALVAVTKLPELEISEEEASKLARASVAVAKLYDVRASEKALAWANLLGIAGSIYVTRVLAISARVTLERSVIKNAGSNGAGGPAFNIPGVTPGAPAPKFN